MFSGGVEPEHVSKGRARSFPRRTLHLDGRKVLSCQVDKYDLGQDRVQWALLQLNGQLAEHFTLQLVVSRKLLSLINFAVQSDKPCNQSAPSVVAVR
jgi:hypothetical protein